MNACLWNVNTFSATFYHRAILNFSKVLKFITTGSLLFSLIVLAAVQDEATSAAMYYGCKKALEVIGGKRPFQNDYRASFAMIGYKGKRNVTWVEQKKSASGRGPTNLKNRIKLMTFNIGMIYLLPITSIESVTEFVHLYRIH